MKLRVVETVAAAVALLALGWTLWRLRPLSAEQIADRVSESVVVVRATKATREVVGTGFAVSDSLIATNYHVVRGASAIRIQLQGGQTFDGARVVTYDAERDLALVLLSGPTLRPLRMFQGTIKQGARVLVLSHPAGLGFSLSEGLVSSVRDIGDVRVLQMTVPISPGSSGGPVVDGRGRVVGVATGFLQGGQNLNFAVRAGHLADLIGSIRGSGVRAAVPTSSESDVGGLGAADLETGVYQVGFTYAGRQEDFALYLDAIGDSARGRFGPSSAAEPPSRRFAAPVTNELPLAISLGDASVTLNVEHVRSPRLFVGTLVRESFGTVDSTYFTAARRRPSLEGAETYIVVDAGGATLQPKGAGSYEPSFALAGTVSWRDAGLLNALGTFEPFEQYTSGVSAGRDVFSGRLTAADSVQFRLGPLTCQLPIAGWPNAEGACWTPTKWFGITQAVSRSASVRRYLWRMVPPRVDRLSAVSLSPDGGVEVLLASESTVSRGRRVTRAWTAPAESEWGRLTRVPWPSYLPPSRLSHQALADSGLVLLDDDHFARWRRPGWDTIPIPHEVFPGFTSSVRTARFSQQRDLVLWSTGWCNSFQPLFGPAPSDSTCGMIAAVFNASLGKWTRLPGLPPRDFFKVWGFLQLSDTSVLFELNRRNESEWLLATPTRVRRVRIPVVAGPMRLAFPMSPVQTAATAGRVYSIVAFCNPDDSDCWTSRQTRRDLMAWTPGAEVETMRTDSTGALFDVLLFVTNTRRVVALQEGDTLRFVDHWETPLIRGDSAPLFGIPAFVLEDSVTGRVHIVTSLGEVVDFAAPTSTSRDRRTGWIARAWARIKRATM